MPLLMSLSWMQIYHRKSLLDHCPIIMIDSGYTYGNVCGHSGISHTNDAGRKMHYLLSIRGLTTATTFFQKKSHGTLIHPCSKPYHQLDHIITNRDKLCTITYPGVTESMVDSDRHALKCKLRMQLKLAKRPPPPPLLHLNLAKLQSQETSTEFCEKSHGIHQPTIHHHGLLHLHSH